MMPTTSNDPCLWVPAYLSDLLMPGEVVQTYVDRNDVALWRAHSGKVNAWSNRCPHRGMRLSHGFVRGDMLACIYHGWHYGSDGGCKYIPAHPDLEPPSTICTDGFECIEQDGLIWISPESSADKPDALPTRHAVRSMTFWVSKQFLTDALVKYGSSYLAMGGSSAIILGTFGVSLTLADRTKLTIAVQEISPQETFLHVLSDVSLSAEKKTGISRNLDRLRERIESEDQAQ
ncbi:MAG: Rieske (2Fe-2S) protein [Stappiaceae bacterium]